MNKAIKKIAMLFVVCGLAVSVSFGYYMFEDEEANYQKLKVEMEEVESLALTNFDENKCFNGDYHKNAEKISDELKGKFCRFKNVLAFFDEIRAIEVKVDKKKGEREFYVAINKAKEMPRFKEDSGIRITKMSINESRFTNDYAFGERVFEEWKYLKLELKAYGHYR